MISQNQISKEVKQLLDISVKYSKDNLNGNIFPAHLLKALLHKDFEIKVFLKENQIDYYYLLDWADTRIQLYPKSLKVNELPDLDDASIAVFNEAENIRLKLNLSLIDPFCILISLATPGVGFTFENLKTFPLNPEIILSKLAEKGGNSKAPISTDLKSNVLDKKGNTITKLCYDKCLAAQQGQIEPIIGLDEETRAIIEILGRRTKPNVLIIGEPGVGKSTLVNALVKRVVEGSVPHNLKNAKIVELIPEYLISGTNYKGETEDRFKTLIDELKQLDFVVLVIESIDVFADKHSHLNLLINIIKQELKKGEITFLASSSVDGYTKFIETDPELNRCFEVVKIEEPDLDEAFRIIKLIKGVYESHHGLSIDDETIRDAIKLAKRYSHERCLPDSSIDLIDRAMALIKTMNQISNDEIVYFGVKLDQIIAKGDITDKLNFAQELVWLRKEIFSRLSLSLISRLDDETDFNQIISNDEKVTYLRNIIEKLIVFSQSEKHKIDGGDLSIIISQISGIPVGKINSKERDKLINAEEILKKRVVGQDHAIKSIIESIYESRSGLNKKGQPMGSFFFLGPTGTGKTELAKSLAEFLFQDESAMIRFDMSEFKEEHSAALLYGAPPGYVGYEEGGLLVNKIRQNPYSVVLFDEIEKAHPSVFDIFLQILDEGKLHDRLGREGNFSNALILFTSNIGSEHIFKAFSEKRIPPSNELMEIMTRHFRPEFLGRLTEIIPFAPISEEIVLMIFNIHLKGLMKTLEEMEISIFIQEEARKKMALSGFSSQYGARPILGVIRNELRRPLSKMIISGKIGKGSKIELILESNEMTWKF